MPNAAQAAQAQSNPPQSQINAIVLELHLLRTELQKEFFDGPGVERRTKLLQAIEAIDLSVELWLGRV